MLTWDNILDFSQSALASVLTVTGSLAYMFHKTSKVQLFKTFKTMCQVPYIQLAMVTVWPDTLQLIWNPIFQGTLKHFCSFQQTLADLSPSEQVNASVPAGMVLVIFGLLLPNHILFMQEHTVFHQSVPRIPSRKQGRWPKSLQQAATKQGVGGTTSGVVHFQKSIIKIKLGKSEVFLNK